MQGEPCKESVYALKQKVMEYFGASPKDFNGTIQYNQEGDAIWHIAGSLRMGERGAGVVDHNLKFHEYNNLYVCDLSVFPDIPAVNPSLTLGALALRLARHLAI
jgi:choline dehydrogenase-like flavoprotein